jgi:hypothetical protein
MSQNVPLRRTKAGTSIEVLPAAFGEEFPQNQRVAVLALLAGSTLSAAAEAAGVDRRTIHRWKQDPQFVAILNEKRHELASASIQALRALAPLAVVVVRELMLDRRVSPAVRLRAALEVIDLVYEDRIGPTDPVGAKAELGRRMVRNMIGFSEPPTV